MVVLSPTEARQVEQEARLLGLVRLTALQSTAREGAVEDETAHPFGMPGRVLDRDRAALAGGDQGEARGIAAASMTHSKSRTQFSNETSSTFRSESPQPRES